MDVFSYLTQRFYAQYIDLRSFYFGCSNIRYVTSIIAVPSLPQDPPKFEAPNDAMPISRPKKSPRPRVVEPEPELEIDVPLPSSSIPIMQQQQQQMPMMQPSREVDLFASFSQAQAQPQSYTSNPFFGDSFTIAPQKMAQPMMSSSAPALEAYGVRGLSFVGPSPF
jgi:hypothetical protein